MENVPSIPKQTYRMAIKHLLAIDQMTLNLNQMLTRSNVKIKARYLGYVLNVSRDTKATWHLYFGYAVDGIWQVMSKELVWSRGEKG